MSATLRIQPELLKQARLQQALSQRALARKANVRPATVSDVENGSQARLSTIKALADALGLLPTEIACLSD